MVNYTHGFIEGHVCGFTYSLWRYLQEADIDNMNAYGSTVESAIETLPPDVQINVPIVFHVITDHATTVNKFDPNYLLTFINSYFSTANIQFGLAKFDTDGNEIPFLGMNEIKGGIINSVRLGVNYNYAQHGVALNDFADKDHTIAVPGIPIEEIQSLPQIQGRFPSKKYLNIILVNKINKIPDTELLANAVSSYSCNPYFADILGKPQLLSPVIPFWAIGKSNTSYLSDPDSPEEIENSVNSLKTNFGYTYENSPVRGELADAGVLNAGMASRGRTIAHAIAHSFGLSHTRNVFHDNVSLSCNEELGELYSAANINHAGIYRDFIEDTATINYPSAGYSHLTEEELNSINPCSDNLVHSDVLNHMHLNQLLPGENPELSELYGNSYDNYSFSFYQIRWMKANFYYYIEGNTPGLFEPNYLNQVASNYNVATGIPIVIEDDGDGENQDGGEGNNADDDNDDETSEVGPCDDGNRSLLTPKSNINLSSNSINFNSKLNSVQNILNNITND